MTQDVSWLDSMPEIYDRCLGPTLFRPWAQHVAGVVAALHPASVLEIAAGTGILTEQLVRAVPDASITATDLNPAMVDWAAAKVPGPTWQQADAQQLDLPDATFDVVVCQFGAMFFPDRPGAFAEAARVLRPGGTLLFTVWDDVDTSSFPAALMAALTDLLPDGPPDFIRRIPHGYHDAARLRADLDAGGLVPLGVEHVVPRGVAPSVAVLAEGYCYGTPLQFALQERGDLDTLAAQVADAMTGRLGPGPAETDLAGYLVTARTDG